MDEDITWTGILKCLFLPAMLAYWIASLLWVIYKIPAEHASWRKYDN